MILDASAILAVLYMEAGQEIVEQALESGATACTVNLAEAATVLIRHGMAPTEAESLLMSLPLVLRDADEELALAAGKLFAVTRPFGLSLADRFCLALAARESQPAMTGDRAWARVGALLNIEIRLIR